MAAVPEVVAPVSPQLVAGLLLAGLDHLRRLGLPHPLVAQVIEVTGASRSRAYELRDVVLDALPSLQRPVGRPVEEPRSGDPGDERAVMRAALRFVMDHSGCVYGGEERRRYDDAFRHFAVALREQHQGLGLDVFASALGVPLGTMKDWLRSGALGEPVPDGDTEESDPEPTPMDTQIDAVLTCWKSWHGTFGDFCEHMQQQWRIPFGHTLIGNILRAHGCRSPRRRCGRSPDEDALRDSFETFFPGAQWVGDGSPIVVRIGAERFAFNLELMVDAYSGGFVGMSVRDEEDGAAVVEAVRDGVETTGGPPLSVLLDNRPSNHTSEVDAELGESTERMRATPHRPQNKAHCEGAFGLFQQAVPALELDATNLRECARKVLVLVTQTWARTLNHRPRADRKGRSRVDLYGDEPTTAQIEAARAALKERCRKQELARATRKARQDPVVRDYLDRAFERLALLDPDGHIRLAIARYPLDVVVDGVAIFEAKRWASTLPAGADARYVLGIVRNIGDAREGIAMVETTLRARLGVRDLLLAPLIEARDEARASTSDPRDLMIGFIDRALRADARLDRFFWLLAAVDVIGLDTKGDSRALMQAAARRIHGTHRVTYWERQEAAGFLIAHLVPLS